MKYHELGIATTRPARRVGRGIAAGQGKTAGRGTKGQKSRTGSSKRAGFEGGQNPLLQRLPKLRGFTSHRNHAEVIYLEQLEKLTANITNQTLAEAGLISSPYATVKLLKRGVITKKLVVKLQSASKSAIHAIEKAGGNFTHTPRQGRPKTSKKSNLTEGS